MTELQFTDVQRDCLQELVNVAMGQASDKLARYLGTFVHLQVPAIALVEAALLSQHFASRYQQQSATLVSLGFFGDQGLRGETIMLYQLANVGVIAQLLGYSDDAVSEAEMLTDISSVLTTTFLSGLAEQLENSFSYAAPRILSCRDQYFADKLAYTAEQWQLALQVDIRYQLTDYSFNCDMILLIPGEAVLRLRQTLDNILADF
ncbi:chemotaxis protein CheC [Rheinheimera pacifica]|uniref:chemotaxis protein n=1 Tax=Rheinheimera pacifica TaxID=173990 RepID=UPI000CBADB12|nr:chemotaxis protein [Rheinheimera pacifica]MDR6981578.1 chemotaxis protein CheC [Rheinheimera pacifica]PKM19153.1 MAG: chemotaxis protein [Gammaproteobacteria bacterium HGW-Gammaproteobacteria-15]